MERATERRVFATLGATNHSDNERATNDYYATDPMALVMLLDKEQFSNDVWECACGDGALSKVLEARGYNVLSTDLVDRGYGTGGVDFLELNEEYDGDIVTNPPYSKAQAFVEKALDVVTAGHKVAMLLRLQFLETKARRALFEKFPPKYVYVSSSRIQCARNGDFENYGKGSAVAYAWFVWEKGFNGEPIVRWFN
jgi:hypothetical protein